MKKCKTFQMKEQKFCIIDVVEIGKRFNIPIITKSTFNNRPGSVINDKIEDTKVKEYRKK